MMLSNAPDPASMTGGMRHDDAADRRRHREGLHRDVPEVVACDGV
jgi:hypothetical protein